MGKSLSSCSCKSLALSVKYSCTLVQYRRPGSPNGIIGFLFLHSAEFGRQSVLGRSCARDILWCAQLTADEKYYSQFRVFFSRY